MSSLESAMFAAGWVRCPNNALRWYAGSAGKLEPVFPLELRVTDEIWLVTYRYADPAREVIPLMCFGQSVDALETYLKSNGRPCEVGGPNVAD